MNSQQTRAGLVSRRSLLIGGSLVGLIGAGYFVSRWGSPDLPTSWEPNRKPLSMQAAWSNDAEFLGYYIAKDNGYYDSENLNLQYLPGGPEIVADTVLLSGRCDLALTTPDGTISAITKQNAPVKIIGTQYQKSPLGIVSLKENNINEPKDLIGKRLAVPAANVLTTQAFLKLNAIDPGDVKFVPYAYDPTPLIEGAVQATVDFVTNVPYSIRLRNKEPTSFLFYDHNFRLFMDTVTVTDRVLSDKRGELIGFLRGSRKGWDENFRDPKKYPNIFKDTWFKGTGRTVDNEIYFNQQQKPLMEAQAGIFSMGESDIEDNIRSLNAIGLKATRAMFVTDLLKEV